MSEEFKTQGEPLEQDKIGTKVTYKGDDSSPEVDLIFGVPVKKGESVDFAEHMDPAQAKRFARRLAGSHLFSVEGAPQAKPPEQRPFVDSVAANDAASRAVYERALAERQGREPPEGYDAPLQAVLESSKPQKASKGGEDAPPARSNPPKGR